MYCFISSPPPPPPPPPPAQLAQEMDAVQEMCVDLEKEVTELKGQLSERDSTILQLQKVLYSMCILTVAVSMRGGRGVWEGGESGFVPSFLSLSLSLTHTHTELPDCL